MYVYRVLFPRFPSLNVKVHRHETHYSKYKYKTVLKVALYAAAQDTCYV